MKIGKYKYPVWIAGARGRVVLVCHAEGKCCPYNNSYMYTKALFYILVAFLKN
jgi:hypothetical protein